MLTPESLVLEKQAGVYKTQVVKYLTEHLGDLHFVKRQPGVSVFNKRNEDEIQFQNDGVVHSFAPGISEAEANSLICEMQKIYPFPSKGLKQPMAPEP